MILCIYSNIASVLKAVPKSVKFMLAPLKSVWSSTALSSIALLSIGSEIIVLASCELRIYWYINLTGGGKPGNGVTFEM